MLKNIMAPDGPLFFIIFIFRLIQLNRLNWTQFIAVNYTDEPAVGARFRPQLTHIDQFR